MEKPRKKELLDRTQTIIHGIRAFASYGIGARIYGDGVDDIHLQKAITAAKDIESMSAWLEGQVPTVEEIEKVILLESNLDVYGIHKLAKAMHAMLAHKLTGSGK